MSARTAAPDRRGARPRARRWTAVVWVTVVLLLVPVLAASYVGHRITSRLDRVDGVFAGLRDRPSRPAGGRPGAGSLNLLLVVTDHRAGWSRAPHGDPADAVMLLHLARDRRSAVVAALPSAAWVGAVDRVAGRPSPGAGLTAAVGAVEGRTHVRVDHVAVVDWEEFAELTDLLGGVELHVPLAVPASDGSVWWPGLRYFTGAAALDYVRPHAGAPGDAATVERRQQTFLEEVLRRSLHQEMARSPRMLQRFLESVAGHTTVDAGWSTVGMARLVVSLRHLRSADLAFVVPPAAPAAEETFWERVRTDAGPPGGAPEIGELSAPAAAAAPGGRPMPP